MTGNRVLTHRQAKTALLQPPAENQIFARPHVFETADSIECGRSTQHGGRRRKPRPWRHTAALGLLELQRMAHPGHQRAAIAEDSRRDRIEAAGFTVCEQAARASGLQTAIGIDEQKEGRIGGGGASQVSCRSRTEPLGHLDHFDGLAGSRKRKSHRGRAVAR